MFFNAAKTSTSLFFLGGFLVVPSIRAIAQRKDNPGLVFTSKNHLCTVEFPQKCVVMVHL